MSEHLFKGPKPTTEEARALLARWSLVDLVNLVATQAVRASGGTAMAYSAEGPFVKVTVRVKKVPRKKIGKDGGKQQAASAEGQRT